MLVMFPQVTNSDRVRPVSQQNKRWRHRARHWPAGGRRVAMAAASVGHGHVACDRDARRGSDGVDDVGGGATVRA